MAHGHMLASLSHVHSGCRRFNRYHELGQYAMGTLFPLKPAAACAEGLVVMQVEDEAATSTSQQQAHRLQESHTSFTAALEQVAAHGKRLLQITFAQVAKAKHQHVDWI